MENTQSCYRLRTTPLKASSHHLPFSHSDTPTASLQAGVWAPRHLCGLLPSPSPISKPHPLSHSPGLGPWKMLRQAVSPAEQSRVTDRVPVCLLPSARIPQSLHTDPAHFHNLHTPSFQTTLAPESSRLTTPFSPQAGAAVAGAPRPQLGSDPRDVEPRPPVMWNRLWVSPRACSPGLPLVLPIPLRACHILPKRTNREMDSEWNWSPSSTWPIPQLQAGGVGNF